MKWRRWRPLRRLRVVLRKLARWGEARPGSFWCRYWPYLLSAGEWRRYAKRRRAASQGFELGWLSWTGSALFLLAFTNFAPWPPQWSVVNTVGNLALGALIAAYFGHLFLRRLQCSLLEWILLIAVLGNAEGLVLATPGLWRLPLLAFTLAAFMAGWVFYGAVLGLVQARLLGVKSVPARLGLLIAAWWSLASPALLLCGSLLALWGQGLAGPRGALWGWPILALGVLGAVLGLWLMRRSAKAARAVLGERANNREPLRKSPAAQSLPSL
jgi:MFS family permease